MFFASLFLLLNLCTAQITLERTVSNNVKSALTTTANNKLAPFATVLASYSGLIQNVPLTNTLVGTDAAVGDVTTQAIFATYIK